MSNGADHYKAYKKGWKDLPALTLLVWLSTALYWWPPIEIVLRILEMSSFLYVLGRWVDPDLDQPGISSAEGRMVKDFWIIGYALLIYWMAYALAVGFFVNLLGHSKNYLASHRSKATHSVIGTAIRAFLVFTPFFAILYLMFTFSLYNGFWIEVYSAVLIALLRADLIHYRLDKIPVLGVKYW